VQHNLIIEERSPVKPGMTKRRA